MLTRVDLTLDCTDAVVVAEFWKAAAGYEDEPPPAPFATRAEWLASFGIEDDDPSEGAWLHDPAGIAPRLSILRVPEPKIAKNRLHMDLRVSGTGSRAERWADVRAEVERLKVLGGTVVAQDHEHHVVMADPEGNEFCVA